MEWYLKVLRQYADRVGRTRRKEYWMFTLVSLIISIVLATLVVLATRDGVLNFDGNSGVLIHGLLAGLYTSTVLLPSWAVGVRRLHNTGRSGWWLLIGLIPLIGWIVIIVFLAIEGEGQPNAYGPDPKGVPDEAAVVA
jgi:uncharacterized membrane protein YhaH (DUF805 family)